MKTLLTQYVLVIVGNNFDDDDYDWCDDTYGTW